MRFLLTLTGTIAGLAALLGLKGLSSAAPATGPVAGPGSSASSTAAGGGAGAGSANGGNTNGSGAAAGSGKGGSGTSGSGTSGSSGASAGSGASTTRTATGSAISTEYGPMQVQVSVAGQKVTAVKVLQQTNSGQTSQQIDANAIPQLTRETLTAQSANISAVSGASYTSGGYIKSLQSALDQVKA
jgi:hypothetical protein